MTSKTAEAIISHMNADHKTSLYDYLAHFSGVKLDLDDPRKSVELVDVRLDKLTLNYNESGALKSTVIPLDPPMNDLGEARYRLISMAFTAADARGVSPYRITKYVQPTTKGGIFSVVLGSVVATLGGIALSSTLAKEIVGYGTRLHKLIKATFYATMAIHLFEIFLHLLPLLRFYRVPSLLRLRYLVTTLLVGFPGWHPLQEKAKELDERRAQFEKKF